MMKTADIVGLGASCLILGWAIGMMTNADISYFAGELNARKESKAEAMRWAKNELIRSCPSWYTDSRKGDYMACTTPDWMNK